MRHYQSMRVPPFVDRALRGELRKVDQWLRLLSTQQGRSVSLPQGTASGSIGANLGDYLYLPGRPNGQISYGRVRFQAKALPSGLVSVPDTAQSGFGFMATLTNDGLTSLNIWLQSTAATSGGITLTPNPSREWAFPAFNEPEGDTAGLHFFVDESNHQSLVNKTFRSCRYVAGTTSGEGWLDNTETRYFHWSLENLPNNRNASSHATTATRPSIQVSPLDVQTGLGVGQIDNTHTMAVVRVPRSGTAFTATPFEIGGPIFGGDTARELYGVGSAAKGAWAGPSQGDLLTFNPTTSFTGDVNFSNSIINIASTANMRVGMRVRDTRTSTAYVERFITQITSGTSILVDVAFSENTAAIPFAAFGPIWSPTSTITGINHFYLTNLTYPADDHTQYLNLFGRTGGQILAANGSGATHSGLSTTDFAVHGTLVVDPNSQNFSFTQVRAIDSRSKPTSGSILAHQFFYDCSSQSTGGTGNAVNMQVSGTFAGSTAATLRGLNLIGTVGLAAGSTMTEATAGFFSNVPSGSGTGTLTWSRLAGLRVTCGGQDLVSQIPGSPPTPAPLTITNGVCGIEIIVGPKAMQGALSHICLTELSSSTATQSVTDYWGIVMATNPGGTVIAPRMDMANVVNWTFMEIPSAPTNPTGTIRGLKVGDIKSHHVGAFKFGSTATPTHFVDIAAGTTAIAPIKLTNGTNLTAATAGCVEYDGSFLYMTHGDAVRTKVVTQRGAVDATNQGAAIGATTVYAAPAAGYYVVHYTIETTTADAAAGTIQFQVNYTDDIGATNQTGAALALTATGRDRGAFEVYVNAAQNIQYQTNLGGIIGTSKYALRVRVSYLG